MNQPYIKQICPATGMVLNPIISFYQSCNNAPYKEDEIRGENPFPNRDARRKVVKKSNNRKSTRGRRVQIISTKRIYVDKANEVEGYETGEIIGIKKIKAKKIIHYI